MWFTPRDFQYIIYIGFRSNSDAFRLLTAISVYSIIGFREVFFRAFPSRSSLQLLVGRLLLLLSCDCFGILCTRPFHNGFVITCCMFWLHYLPTFSLHTRSFLFQNCFFLCSKSVMMAACQAAAIFLKVIEKIAKPNRLLYSETES